MIFLNYAFGIIKKQCSYRHVVFNSFKHKCCVSFKVVFSYFPASENSFVYEILYCFLFFFFFINPIIFIIKFFCGNIPLDVNRMTHNNNDVIVKIEGRVEDGKMMTMCA